MQRSAWKLIAITLVSAGLNACHESGVGDPCIPETIPVTEKDGKKLPGFAASESYLETASVQCRTRLCIVHKLDNGTRAPTEIPADPTNNCASPDHTDGCVDDQALAKSVYCTCRCDTDGPRKGFDFCKCPSGFTCEKILGRGGDGVRGSYCVRPTEN